jgi:hypothetical protein
MKKIMVFLLANMLTITVFSQKISFGNENLMAFQHGALLNDNAEYSGYKLLNVYDYKIPVQKKGFENTGFAQFMATPAGRILRVGVGGGLIAWGASKGWSNGGAPLIIGGIVPASAGIFDFCVISPLAGGPFWGKKIRAAKTNY